MKTLKPIKVIKGNHKTPKQYYDIEVPEHESFSITNKKVITHNSNMHGTIINMAQNFVGTNNIELLKPSGNFGSRKNPKASASPRYIFTYLNSLTKLIFNSEDDNILEYNYEDGDKIEPKFYLPIIPMLLVNGASGIGTGWSTDIPKYDAKSIIKIIIRKLKKPSTKYKIAPHYNNWNGEMEFDENNNKYTSKGTYSINNTKRKIHITELPINMSTDKYIEHLDKLLNNKVIKKIVDNCTDEVIDITIDVDVNFDFENILKILKLTTSISLNNMHSFKNDRITKYDSAEKLLNDWIDFRLPYYSLRKKSQIKIKTNKYNKYFNIVCFLNAVIKDTLIINKRPKDEIIKDLEKMEFLKIDGDFNYLLNIPIYHFSKEKYDEYKKLALDIKDDLELYKNMKPEDIWISELTELNKNI